MRKVSALFVVVVLLTTGCFGRSGRVGLEEEGHIPLAQESGVLRDINFAYDSSDIDTLARSILQENAVWLRANPSVVVQIEGHCDERGTAEYNMALGHRRARAVYDALRTMGISSEQLSTVSYGKELPLDPRSNEEAWARNRRAHFNLVK